jgi:ABC-type amino acid transport substrate-binding protein
VIKHSKLADEGAYFYAFNLKSNPEVVGRLQAAIDKLKRQGRVDALVHRYTQP